MGTAPWQDKIKRRHVVRFYPSRNLATFEVDDLVNKVRDALGGQRHQD